MTEHGKVNPWIVAIAVMFATFMEVLDTTVVNVSLPHIASTMSSTTEEATWALTSYLVANAIILPMTGWLASVLGRKRLLMWSVTGFTLASFLCGIAPNLADHSWLYGGDMHAITTSIREGRNGFMPAWRNRLGVDRSRLVAAWVVAQAARDRPAKH